MSCVGGVSIQPGNLRHSEIFRKFSLAFFVKFSKKILVDDEDVDGDVTRQKLALHNKLSSSQKVKLC